MLGYQAQLARASIAFTARSDGAGTASPSRETLAVRKAPRRHYRPEDPIADQEGTAPIGFGDCP